MKLHALIYIGVIGFVESTLQVVPMTCKMITKLVDGHNEKRLQLLRGELEGQPPASEMKSVVWDAELAEKAEQWAKQHVFKHNPDTTIGSKRFQTGENIYKLKSTNLKATADPADAVTQWWNEYKYYTYGPLTPAAFSSPDQIGHYTQVAWSNSTYLGCGMSVSVEDKATIILVCNYGPAGNYMGQKPYKSNGKKGKKLTCGAKDCSQPYGAKCAKKL